MIWLALGALLLQTLLTLASPSSSHIKRRSGHDLHALFRRQSTQYPPQDQIGPAPLPTWMQTYQAVKARGLIPGFSNSTNLNAWPQYPAGMNPADPAICSFALAKCTSENDIVNAPDGFLGVAFDDGPQDPTPMMLNFLQQNNIPATHFLIGSRIAENPDIFQQTIKIGGHLAVHTWSHPLMTTLTDQQIVGELGWTLQIIYDQSGGYLPLFWRPPYGDVDNRVRAIAENVFGLVTTLWNQDSDDWCLADDGTDACPTQGPHTDAGLARELRNWFTGSQSPVLNMSITIGLSPVSKTLIPLFKAPDGKYTVCFNFGFERYLLFADIPDLFNMPWYVNAQNDQATPLSATIGIGAASLRLGSPSPVPTSATSTLPTAASSALSSPSAVSHAPAGNLAAGWAHLSKGAQNGIVGGAIGLGVLSIAVLAYFCTRRCMRPTSKRYPTGQQPNRRSMVMVLDEKRSSFFPNASSHPYDEINNDNSLSFEKLPDFSPTPALRYDQDSKLLPVESRQIKTIRAVQQNMPLLSPPTQLRAPQNDFRPNSSTMSVYSQDPRATRIMDPFASPAPPALPAGAAHQAARKSGFHRPNRGGTSPYEQGRTPTLSREDWI